MMARVRRRLLGQLAVLLGVLVLAGCVSIPTSGPVVPGSGPSRAPDVAVEVAPEPPRPGASPRTVVDGFLQAMATYQQGYPVARLYLSSSVRDSWRPEEGATVYADGHGVTSTSDSAELTAPLVGRIGADGSYAHAEGSLQHDFALVRDVDGQWRIANPPRGLLLSQYLFGKFYDRYEVYFFEPTMRRLVPDPVYLPRGNQTATALLQALLRGPTEWLRPAVTTALPAQARLNVQSAAIDAHGVVEVSLNEAVAQMPEDQRFKLAAQLSWTLSQVDGVTGLRLLVNGAPWTVREQNSDGVLTLSSFSSFDPVASGGPGSLVGATEEGAVLVSDSAAGVSLPPVPGPLGRTRGITGVAVNTTGDRVATVTAGGTRLQVARFDDSPLQPVMEGRSVLRPQFLASGAEEELWTFREEGGAPELWIATPAGERRLRLLGFEGTEVTAFRISPDGTRMAVVRARQGVSELGLLRIQRTQSDLVVDGWRPVPLGSSTEPGPNLMVDVAWESSATMLVLGSEGPKKSVKPYRLDQSAAEVSEIGQPDNWMATQLAVAPRRVGTQAVVIGRENSYRFEDDYRWPLLVRGLRTAAYGG